MRVLVVEDEVDIADDIAACLAEAGFAVEPCDNGEEAWFLGGTEDFDAVILDLGLPRLDGLTVLRRWRIEGRAMPVIVLTARGSWSERVDGINAGADDYLSKPFQMEELIARLRAVLRRSLGHSSALLSAGEIQLDTRLKSVTVDGRAVHLTALEFRLASYLLHHLGRVVSREEISEHLYGGEHGRDANAIEALIARVRRKLGADSIETLRGQGYRIKAKT
jgi:DNA-binding response OmpR family regulator